MKRWSRMHQRSKNLASSGDTDPEHNAHKNQGRQEFRVKLAHAWRASSLPWLRAQKHSHTRNRALLNTRTLQTQEILIQNEGRNALLHPLDHITMRKNIHVQRNTNRTIPASQHRDQVTNTTSLASTPLLVKRACMRNARHDIKCFFP